MPSYWTSRHHQRQRTTVTDPLSKAKSASYSGSADSSKQGRSKYKCFGKRISADTVGHDAAQQLSHS
ncbi:hypothetical protein TNCV_162081 [Trichonephila clavipes]|nr:hypothetical protein TNCV_162081 [Trichonephila clavipes]